MNSTTPDMRAVLDGYLRKRFPERDRLSIARVDRAGFGASHVHYFVTANWQERNHPVSQDLVFRVPPEMGCVPPYDIARQYRIMESLRGAGVMAPEVRWLETDTSVIGFPFIVMEKMEGEMMMGVGMCQPELLPAMRKKFIDLLVRLHRLDWKARGFSSLGVPANEYECAQDTIQRWERTMEENRYEPHPVLVEAVRWLKGHVLPSRGTTLVHGDYFVHNMLWRNGEITGLLDWELAEIGDPMYDIGYTGVLMEATGQFWNPPEFQKSYAEAIGAGLDRSAVFFWTLLSYLKFAAIALAGIRAAKESKEPPAQMSWFPTQLTRATGKIAAMLGQRRE